MSGGPSSEHSVTWRQLGACSPTRAVSVRSWKEGQFSGQGRRASCFPSPQRSRLCPCLRQASQQHPCDQAVPCPGGLAGTAAPLLPCPLASTFPVHELSCCAEEAKPGRCACVSLAGVGGCRGGPSVGLGGRRLFAAVTQDVWGSGWELRSLLFCPGSGPRALRPGLALTGPQPRACHCSETHILH